MYRTWSWSRGHCPELHIPLVCQTRHITSPSTFDKGSWGIVPCCIVSRTERDVVLFPQTSLSLYVPNRSVLNHRFLTCIVHAHILSAPSYRSCLNPGQAKVIRSICHHLATPSLVATMAKEEDIGHVIVTKANTVVEARSTTMP